MAKSKAVPRSPAEKADQLAATADDDGLGKSIDHTDDELPQSEPDDGAVDSGPVDETPPPDTGTGAPTESETAPAAELPPGIRGYLASRGLTGLAAYENDEGAIDALLGNVQAAMQRAESQSRQYQQQAALYQQQLAQFQQIQAAAQQQAPAPPAAKPKWQAPEFDPGWAQMLTKDPDGNWVAKPGADPTLPAKYMKAQEHILKTVHRFATDPAGLLDELGYVNWDTAQERMRAEYQAMQAQQQEQQGVHALMQQNLSWMVQHNADGRPVVDPNTGAYVPTPAGYRFSEYVREAERSGITDAFAQFRFAQRSVHAEQVWAAQQQAAQQAAAAPANAARTQAQKNQDFLKEQAGRKPSKSGTVPNAATGRQPAQNGRKLSFVEKAKKYAEEAGIPWDSEVEV